MSDAPARLPDGRTLTLAEHGSPAGPAVVLLPCAPGSRLIDPDPAATRAAGVRLLSVDRPGYGRSDPYPAGDVPTVARQADDVAAALGALGVRDAAVAGWSGGARVALALAARHPGLVRAVALAGLPAPDDEVPWLVDSTRAIVARLAADLPGAVAEVMRMYDGAFGTAEERVATVTRGPADAATLADPDRAARMDAMLVEAFRQGTAGIAIDLVAGVVQPSGIVPGDVVAPVAVFAGGRDDIVPPRHADWWADRLPDARVEAVADAGHLLPLVAWDRMLAALR